MLPVLAQAQYNLVKSYEGSNFFDDWDFYNNFDNLTNGDAIFVSAQQAAQDKLAFVNSAGHAIMKVDNTSQVAFNQKRNTVRIASKDRFSVGSVWVADMLHVPFGCSVWPAWWSQAPGWPAGGEIDTFEAVNLAPRPQMALHTEPGCTVTNPQQSSTLVNATDCSFQANSNEGCVTTNPATNSYGQPFADAGGGVWATEFAEKGISIWFFSRANVPDSLKNNASSLDTSTLGTPVANYPPTNCNIDKFFSAQNLIFDITLCGDFAGNPATFTQTCTGVCYNDFVIGSPSNYDNAYFEVASVRVYGTSSSVDVKPNGNGAARVGSTSASLALVGAAVVGLMAVL
ncbi:glycoside hydrolase family 16 protein [Dentipellis sp. KUC8613]|nr:glycoside hydrolase family 16 protein [Dentipellis sp. KUC8613]